MQRQLQTAQFFPPNFWFGRVKRKKKRTFLSAEREGHGMPLGLYTSLVYFEVETRHITAKDTCTAGCRSAKWLSNLTVNLVMRVM